jgi:hypothetical protein
MRVYDDTIIDTKIYVVINNNGEILRCFANEDNAYSFAIRQCFNYIEENNSNKHVFEELDNIDKDEKGDFKQKLEIIHERYEKLIKSDIDYYHLVRVEEYNLDTNDMYK